MRLVAERVGWPNADGPSVISATPLTMPDNRSGEIDERPPSSRRSLRSLRWSVWPLAFILAACAAKVWFGRYHSHSLMGDDLTYYLRQHATGSWASGVHDAIFLPEGDSKYRPVAALAQLASFHAFGSFYEGYKELNLVIEALNVTLFARLAWLLSRSYVLTVGLAAIALTARFDLYHVMQGFGGEQGLSITFLLVSILAARRGLRGDTKNVAAASLAYAAAIYTYEGMLALGATLILVPLLAIRTNRPWREDLVWRLGWAIAPIAVAGSNIAVKTALGVHFLSGTGGMDIALEPSTVLSFFKQGVASLLGFNNGPDYLSGTSWTRLPDHLGLIVGLGFTVPMTLLAGATMVRLAMVRKSGSSRLARLTELRVPVLGVALALPLLATACVTIRQEYRWLYPPYMLLLLGAAWALGRWRPLRRSLARHGAWVCCCSVLVVAGLAVEVAYRPYAENTYFFGAQAAADSVYDQVFVQNDPHLNDTTILINTQGDQTLTDWILAGGEFFKIYAHGRPVDIRLIPSLAAIRQQNGLRSHVHLLVWNGRTVVATQLPR